MTTQQQKLSRIHAASKTIEASKGEAYEFSCHALYDTATENEPRRPGVTIWKPDELTAAYSSAFSAKPEDFTLEVTLGIDSNTERRAVRLMLLAFFYEFVRNE